MVIPYLKISAKQMNALWLAQRGFHRLPISSLNYFEME